MITKKLLSEQKFVCYINDTAEELAVIFSSCIGKKKKKAHHRLLLHQKIHTCAYITSSQRTMQVLYIRENHTINTNNNLKYHTTKHHRY